MPKIQEEIEAFFTVKHLVNIEKDGKITNKSTLLHLIIVITMNYNIMNIYIYFYFWIFLFRLWGGNRKRFWQLFSSKNGLSFNGGWRFWLHCKGFIQSSNYSSCNGSSRYLEEKKTFEEIFNLEKKKLCMINYTSIVVLIGFDVI